MDCQSMKLAEFFFTEEKLFTDRCATNPHTHQTWLLVNETFEIKLIGFNSNGLRVVLE